jgi:serine protease Do
VQRSGSLSSLIGLSAPGERVKLKVWRDHAERTIEAKLGGADEAKEKVVADAREGGSGQLGLTLRPLSGEEKRQAKLDGGLVVEDVAGAAARAGIQAGDVLLAINGKPVQSIDQVKGVIAGKPKSVALLVQRDGEKIFVPVKVG